MPRIKVHKAFELSIVQDGQLMRLPFAEGEQDVTQDVADHWYTQAHSEPVPDAEVEAADAGEDAGASDVPEAKPRKRKAE